MLGRALLCVPFCMNSSQVGFPHLNNVISYAIRVVGLLAGLLLFLDTVLSNPVTSVVGSQKASEYLSIYCWYGAITWSDFTVRFASIYYTNELIRLTNFVYSMHDSCGSHGSHGSASVKTALKEVCALLLVLWWYIGSTVASLRVDMAFDISDGYDLKLLPLNKLVIRTAYCIADLWSCSALFFGWIFILTAGQALVMALERFEERCKKLATEEDNLYVSRLCWYKDCRTHELVELFSKLRSAFEDYGKVAGAYCFALLSNFTINTIRYLSGAGSSDPATASGLLQGSDSYAGIYPIAIIFIAYFGSYVNSAVSFDD